MDAQLIRYLDGELSERETIGFLERIDNEPELRQALEEEERLLEAARELPEPIPSADFADRVMGAILEEPATSYQHAAAKRARRQRWAFALSAAAMVILAFALGRISNPATMNETPTDGALLVSNLVESSDNTGQPILRPDFLAVDPGAGGNLRIVHLVYAPQDNSPAQVAVAGSFNGWKTGKIAMRQQGETWTATLILPPGSYEYMFVEDDARWVTDPRAPRTRDDGFGGRNAVLDVDA